MILECIKVTGFRSVQSKLGSFWIKPRLTVLIGANEHGKSNLIDALSYLNKGKYESGDKNRSKGMRDFNEEFPDLHFVLRLTNGEKKKVVERLETVKAALPQEQDDDTKKLAEKIDLVLGDIKDNDEPKIKIRLYTNENGSDFRTIAYIFKNGTTWKFLDRPGSLAQGAAEFFNEMLPEVISFKSSDELTNSVTLDQLNKEQNIEFIGLFKLVPNVWDDREKLFENSVEGRDFRDEARTKIQRKLRDIWSQGKQGEADLKIDLDLDTASSELRLDFIDKSGTRDQPTQRSLGFRSFFTFYLKLYALTQEIDPHGYIFAFDEPGIHLHPSGQKDLLRELRRIAEHNQVIISTHSPFMIDRNPLTGVVVVTKDNEGTKLNQKPYRKNWAPLRASLGLVMSDSFFYADKSLFVEGTSDRIFVYALLQKLTNELDIDINFLSVIDGDDRREMPAIARILLSEDRKLVLLTDSDEGGDEIRTQITKIATDLKKKSHLDEIALSKYLTGRSEVSIEDLLPENVLEKAIQKYLKEVLGKDDAFKLSDVKLRQKTLGRALKDYFLEKGWTTEQSSFSKTTVADLFSQILIENESVIPEEHPSRAFCADLREKLELK